MSDLTFKQLRYLLAIARTSSFTSASQLLNVSQPALGLQIRALEEHLGSELLTRGARGIALTEAGYKFLKHAEQILDAVAAAEDDVRRLAPNRVDELALGVTPTCGRALFENLMLGAVSRDAPFRLRLLEGLSDDLIKHLETGRLHCAFCYDAEPNEVWTTVPMYEEDLVLVGRRDIVNEPEVTFRDLEAYPLVLGPKSSASRRAIIAIAGEQKVSLDVRMEIAPLSLKRDVLLRRGLTTIVPYGLFQVDVEGGILGASRIVPEVRRIMSLAIRRDAPDDLVTQIVQTAHLSVESQVREGRLGWRLPKRA